MKNRILTSVFFIFILLSLSSCSQNSNSENNQSDISTTSTPTASTTTPTTTPPPTTDASVDDNQSDNEQEEEENNFMLEIALDRMESEKQSISMADSQGVAWYTVEEYENGESEISSLTQEELDLAKATGTVIAQYTTLEGRQAIVMKADLTELINSGESEEVLNFISDLVCALSKYDMQSKGLTTDDIASDVLDMLNGDDDSMNKLNDLFGDVTKFPSYTFQ